MAEVDDPKTFVERGLALFEELVREEPDVARELQSSRVEFFGGQRVAHDRDAAQRHLEWYLFERHSDALEGLAGERLLPAFRESAEEDLSSRAELFLDSRAGVYEVTSVSETAGVWLQDLTGGGEYPLIEPEAAGALAVGDLIVGRLYPLGDGSFRASPVAGCFRNESLREALRADLASARATRRGIPRLSQAILEGMFFGGGVVEATTSGEEAMARAAAWLMENGVDEERCDAIFDELRSASFDPYAVVLGGSDALGRILDELAFDTSVDLDAARRVLLEAWSALGPRQEARVVREDDVGRALAEFDRRRAAGEDLEALFDRLERALGVEEAGDDDSDSSAPDFPGVVGAMVEEFLWEEGREDPVGPTERRVLERLTVFAADIGVFEDLDARQLLAFASCWMIEQGGLSDADSARAVLGALSRFCRWAEDQHGVPLWTNSRQILASLETSLPRVAEANRHVDRDAGGRAVVRRVVDIGQERAVVRAGNETREVAIARELAANLRVGDLLRVAEHTKPVVVGAYPPESAELLLPN